MNALEQFYIDLDNSGWDHHNEDAIITRLKEVQQELYKADLKDEVRLALIEHQVFQFVKTPEKGLSPMLGGNRVTEDGEKVPFVWPDINWFNNEDFRYIYKRFQNSQENTYAKIEYGLMLYYANKQQRNEFIVELLEALFELLKLFVEKGKKELNYIFDAEHILNNLLHISRRRKNDDKIKVIYEQIFLYLFDVHQNWKISDVKFEHIILRFCNYFINYFKDVNEIEKIDLQKVLVKNLQFAKSQPNSPQVTLTKTIGIADVSIKLSKKLKAKTKEWQHLKAEKFEKIAEIRKGDLADTHFIEQAMLIYKELKDKDNLKRIQDAYQNLRTKHNFQTHTRKLPQDATNEMLSLIKKDIEEKNENELITILMQTPFLNELEHIKKESEAAFKESLMENYFPATIQDKFGNTIEQFLTIDERKYHKLLKVYDYYMQIAMQFTMHFFMEAYKANKISSSGIINFINNSWIGEEAIREVNNINVKFSYIKSIEPGITIFFDELKKWKEDLNYHPNFIASVDSLILKAEYLLREICAFLEIPTFKPNDRNPGVIMEKLLHNILDDLQKKMSEDNLNGKITEDDLFFIKFTLSNKVGYNLRNRVAHGLMDDIEYNLEHALLAIIIILKLSNYQFKKQEEI